MSYIRLHPDVKGRLEELAGEDYSMNEIVEILLDDFLDYDEENE
jgi:predicted transcriptional regulator